MGGGGGVSIPGTFRVATDKTVSLMSYGLVMNASFIAVDYVYQHSEIFQYLWVMYRILPSPTSP